MNGIRLITRRSQVQILPPPPSKTSAEALSGKSERASAVADVITCHRRSAGLVNIRRFGAESRRHRAWWTGPWGEDRRLTWGLEPEGRMFGVPHVVVIVRRLASRPSRRVGG
jgi:hypothetical protein